MTKTRTINRYQTKQKSVAPNLAFSLPCHQRQLITQKARFISGFSLIELMVVVVIITLIAVIALPSYQRHLRHKWQMQAQQQGLLLANQLSRWRSKRLSYSGFVRPPALHTDLKDTINLENTGKIYLPIGSKDNDYYYLLTLTDVTGQFALTQPQANGNGWRMLIMPNPKQALVRFAHAYYLDSLGQRCWFDTQDVVPDISEQIDCPLQQGW